MFGGKGIVSCQRVPRWPDSDAPTYGRMPHADFVHLRVHSAYSLSEGAIKAEKIPAWRRGAMPAVAITDTANLFGALEFSQACAAKGIQPIIGCQIALSAPTIRACRPTRSCCWRRTPRARQPPAAVVARLPGDRSRPEAAACVRHDRRACRRADPAHRRPTGPLARLLAEGQKPEAERLLARCSRHSPTASPWNCTATASTANARWNRG